MNKQIFKTMRTKSILTLTLVLLSLFPWFLRAQQEEYISSGVKQTVIGTSDTRVMASIYETETSVTMKLMGVGKLNVGVIDFAFFYDPDVLRLLYPDGQEVTDFDVMQGNTAVLSSSFNPNYWIVNGKHKNAGISFIDNTVSGHKDMRAIAYDLGSINADDVYNFKVNEGRVETIFEINFLKLNTGQPLAHEDIGIGVQTDGSSAISYQPALSYDGLFLWYRDVPGFSILNRKITPNLFLYRSGQTVTTDPVTDVATTSATLNGKFTAGTMDPSISMLDTTGTVRTGTGRLSNDSIMKYGFIYSTDNVELVIDEFSDFLKINNVTYSVPTATEIAAGTFTRNGFIFNIILSDNSANAPILNYYSPLNGLLPFQTYYAWAYTHYKFETSDVFQMVGNKETFATTDCIALNIGTIFTKTEPTCELNNGAIQVYVTGGSGEYEYSLNGGAFEEYADGLITGLTAGSYQITVRDVIQNSCNQAVSQNFVLYSKNTDLAISVTPKNATNCTDDDGALLVSVSGGTGDYIFTVNGVQEVVQNGMITGLTAGTYIVTVTDDSGCSVTSNEVRINAGNSNLFVSIDKKINAECGENNGSITFTVTGSNSYFYQLDGFPIIKSDDNDPIELENLTAGVHTLRVWDDCKEIKEVITITNGENALAFTAKVTNEKQTCDGSLTGGSITLNVTNGTPNYKYRIDGGEWIDFAIGANSVTLSDMHYGYYRIEVQDKTECTYEINNVTIEREIYVPINVGTIFVVKEPNCEEATGEIQVIASGGSGEYEYNVNNQGYTSYPGGLITGLTANTYTIAVRDANNISCAAATIHDIVLHNKTTDLTITVTAGNASACDAPTGTLYISVSGGSGEYDYTLNGYPATVTNGEIHNRPVGVYVVNVIDTETGCVASSGEVRITSNASDLAININKKVNTECGNSTGSVHFTVTGTYSNTYTYQIDGRPEMTGTIGAPISITGLNAGVHILRVWDKCGEKVDTITITNGENALAFTAETYPEILSCNDDLIGGSIVLNVTNGTPNYQYRVDGGTWKNFASNSSTVTISDLHSGIYLVEVRDANECSYEMHHIKIGREIYTPINVGTIYIAMEPTCDDPKGAIQVIATGGSGQYEYSLDGINFVAYTDGLITGLSAGTYTITVRDANTILCPNVTIRNITLHNSNTDLMVSVTAKDASTCTEPDGILYVSVSGGWGDYKYLLNGQPENVINGMIDGLTAGVYVLVVTDDNGCTASSGEVRISSDESQLFVEVDKIVNTTCGSSTGSVTFTVTGSSNYTYQLDGYPEVYVTHNNPITITTLNAGVHNLHVWDNCGEVTKEIIITNGSNALKFTIDVQNEILSCNGDLIEGSITLNVTNGSPVYKYRVDAGEWKDFAGNNNTVTIEDLHNGIYLIEVKDATGCTYEMSNVKILREIYEPIHVGTVFVAIEPTCGQSNGSIQVKATGGSGNYLYSVNGAAPVAYTNGLINGLPAGTYTISVTDADYNTCAPAIVNNIVLHNSNTDLAVKVTPTHATDCVLPNGSLFISVSGGTGDYTLFLNGNPADEVFIGMNNGLKAGVYVVTVQDASGCTVSSEEVRIKSNDNVIAVNISNTIDTECGYNTGSFTFTVSGTNFYNYQLDGYPVVATTETPITLTGLSAGVHILRIWDECSETVDTIRITNGNNGLSFTVETTDAIVSCTGALVGGTITLNVTNGTPNYQYRIDGGNWLNFAAGLSTITISDVQSGVYLVEVKDFNDCMYEINKVTIGRDNYTEINVGTIFTVVEPLCEMSDGEIQVFATGGSGKYEYSIDGINFVAYTDGIITGLAAGTYTIYVRDAVLTNCPEVAIHNVVLHNGETDLTVDVTAGKATSCSSLDGKLYVSVSGGSGEYIILLDGGPTDIIDGVIPNLKAGVYVVDVVDKNTGCIATSGEVRITSNASNLAVNINNTVNTECGSSTGSITFTVTGSSSYTYQLNGHPAVPKTGNAQIVLTGLSAGVHTLKVWDNCGEVVKEIIITNGDNTLEFTYETTDETVSCDGKLIGGTITLNVTNGTTDYQYRVDGGEWKDFAPSATTTTISNLHTGFYLVEVKDFTGCTYEVHNVTILRDIYQPIQIGTVFVAKEPTCGNSNGSIKVFATGGSGVYEYDVNGQGYTSYPNGLIENLPAGTYTISVRDANSPLCPDATLGNIILYNGNTDLMITVTTENASDCDTPDGKLYVTTTGGSGEYTYTVNGTPKTPVNGVISGLPAGTYIVVVTDVSDNCTASSEEVRISSDESEILITLNNVVDATCGSSTGSIQFTVTGSNNYTYQLNGSPEGYGTDNTPILLTGLSAGVHTLKVWDKCGEYTETITITNGTNGLEFTVEVENETLSCEGDLVEGSITLTVTNGTPNYQYSIDGGVWTTFSGSSVIIPDLHSGIYLIEVRDAAGCTYERHNVTILRETAHGTLITPPVATSPQTFCGTATVGNLQAIGTGIKWYLTAEGGIALDPSTELVDGTIYYAAQSVGTCESQMRTAVKVVIDTELVLDAPDINPSQSFCGTEATLTLADIATNGNTNIVWYDEEIGGNLLPITTPLQDNTSYYAAYVAGTCESAERTEVFVTFTNDVPKPVKIDSPQQFCEGAVIANITVPNNQIVWYSEATNGDTLPQNYVLQHNVTYYAAQKAGECESIERTPVLILLTTPELPILPELQQICGKTTLADLTVTGSGIVWYDEEENGNQLPLTTVLVVGETYWAAQSSGNCEGPRASVTITDDCYKVYGTMFPFVYTQDEEFDAKYEVTVKLHTVPAIGTNPLTQVMTVPPVQTVKATYYNGSIFIPGTPKYPGVIGSPNNPGKPINWASIGKDVTGVNNELVIEGEVPQVPVGMFTFTNITPGDYILEIAREGYLVRWGKITINNDGMSLGHRELIAGDVTKDLQINMWDVQNALTEEQLPAIDINLPLYDLDGSGTVANEDIQIIIKNMNAYIGTYMETMEWVSGY